MDNGSRRETQVHSPRIHVEFMTPLTFECMVTGCCLQQPHAQFHYIAPLEITLEIAESVGHDLTEIRRILVEH